MADAIINPVEMNPSIPTVIPTAPAQAQADSKSEAEQKREAVEQARGAVKVAHQATVEAEKEAKQRAREEKKAKAKLARETKVKDNRPRETSAPEVWRAAYQEAAGEASVVSSPFVAEVLAQSERAARAFERDLAAQPASQAKLDALTSARDSLRAVFEEDQGLLVLGLRSVRGGEDFVAANRDPDKVKMAKQLFARMTPHHLGHNQPLLDATKKSLAEYEEAQQTLSEVREATNQANARIAEGKRLVQLAVAALKSAVAAAQAQQELQVELQAERKLTHSKAA